MLPVPVPTLDELAAHPERASEIPPATARALLARLAGVQTALLARLLATSGHDSDPAPVEDRLLTASEAAGQLGHSRDWLYRHAARLPFTVRTGRDVRFSAAGLARCIRTRQRRG